jgi:hypothetical protein
MPSGEQFRNSMERKGLPEAEVHRRRIPSSSPPTSPSCLTPTMMSLSSSGRQSVSKRTGLMGTVGLADRRTTNVRTLHSRGSGPLILHGERYESTAPALDARNSSAVMCSMPCGKRWATAVRVSAGNGSWGARAAQKLDRRNMMLPRAQMSTATARGAPRGLRCGC